MEKKRLTRRQFLSACVAGTGVLETLTRTADSYFPIVISDENGRPYLGGKPGECDIAYRQNSVYGGIVATSLSIDKRQLNIRMAELYAVNPIDEGQFIYNKALTIAAQSVSTMAQVKHSLPFCAQNGQTKPDCGPYPQAVVAIDYQDRHATLSVVNPTGFSSEIVIPENDIVIGLKEYGQNQVIVQTQSRPIQPPDTSSIQEQPDTKLYLFNTNNQNLTRIILENNDFRYGTPEIVQVGSESFLAVANYTDPNNPVQLYKVYANGWAQTKGISFPGFGGVKLKATGDWLTNMTYDWKSSKTTLHAMRVDQDGLIVQGYKLPDVGGQSVAVLGTAEVTDLGGRSTFWRISDQVGGQIVFAQNLTTSQKFNLGQVNGPAEMPDNQESLSQHTPGGMPDLEMKVGSNIELLKFRTRSWLQVFLPALFR